MYQVGAPNTITMLRSDQLETAMAQLPVTDVGNAAELLSAAPGRLRVLSLVVTEGCYLLETRLGPVTVSLWSC